MKKMLLKVCLLVLYSTCISIVVIAQKFLTNNQAFNEVANNAIEWEDKNEDEYLDIFLMKIK